MNIHHLSTLIILASSLHPSMCTPGPPLIWFNGLVASFSGGGKYVYDNTTCMDRCCNKVEVHSSEARCNADWTACAVRKWDSRLPQCNRTLTTGCSAWVPCDANKRTWFYVPWAVLFVVSVLAWVCVYRRDFDHNPCAEFVNGLIFMFTKVVLLSLALVPISDYWYWTAQTETSQGLVSYQACVTYCHHLDDPDVIRTRFCEDDRNSSLGYDVFEADWNPLPLPAGGCGIGGHWTVGYCKSCYAKADDWKVYEMVVTYLLARALIEWVMLLVLKGVYQVDRYEYSHWGCPGHRPLRVAVWCFFLLQCLFLALDVYVTHQCFSVQTLVYIWRYAGSSQDGVIDVGLLCAALAVFDGLYFLVMVMGGCGEWWSDSSYTEQSDAGRRVYGNAVANTRITVQDALRMGSGGVRGEEDEMPRDRNSSGATGKGSPLDPIQRTRKIP